MNEAKTGCGIVGVVVAVIGVVLALSLGVWGARVFFAEEIGRGNAEIQIQSSQSRISRYEYFFNQCASVQTLESTIDREADRLEETKSEPQRAVILTNLSGLYASRERAVNQYNADANKEYTSAQFQASNLPFNINPGYEAGGVKTTCAA